MSKTRILEDQSGNLSSTRLIGVTVIINALLMVWACIIFGYKHPDQFIEVIGISTGLFTGITTGTFVYLYNNKKKELETKSGNS
jgi:hypothetical protein